jgi:hypothetical protein
MYPAHEVADFAARFFGIVQQSVADAEKESKK